MFRYLSCPRYMLIAIAICLQVCSLIKAQTDAECENALRRLYQHMHANPGTSMSAEACAALNADTCFTDIRLRERRGRVAIVSLPRAYVCQPRECPTDTYEGVFRQMILEKGLQYVAYISPTNRQTIQERLASETQRGGFLVRSCNTRIRLRSFEVTLQEQSLSVGMTKAPALPPSPAPASSTPASASVSAPAPAPAPGSTPAPAPTPVPASASASATRSRQAPLQALAEGSGQESSSNSEDVTRSSPFGVEAGAEDDTSNADELDPISPDRIATQKNTDEENGEASAGGPSIALILLIIGCVVAALIVGGVMYFHHRKRRESINETLYL